MRRPDLEDTARLIIDWFVLCVMGVGFMIGLIYLAVELAQWLSRH